MKGNVGPDHRSAIMDLLHERGTLSRGALADLSGLSPATVSRSLAALLRAGLVQESVAAGDGPGRPARAVELRPDGALVVGIDAGGSMLRAVLADLVGTVRRRVASPARDPRDPALLVADLVDLVRAAIADDDPARVLAAAAGISGIVDHASGRVRMSPDLPGLDGVGIAARLAADLGIPVEVDNDDLLAAVGEAAAGAAQGSADVVFLSLGFGLGAGILVDGRPVRGAAHAAGAIGSLGTPALDERASGRAIPGRYREALARTGRAVETHGGAQALDARAVFERAEAGDPAARAIVADVVAAIADVATDVAALVDPSVIVVGGGLAAGRPLVVQAVEERLAGSVPFPPRVVPSALEGAAVVHGAVALALAHVRSHLPDPSGGADAPSRRGRRRTALQLV
jgi:predicted NBD/HSP70 family sugar kinase